MAFPKISNSLIGLYLWVRDMCEYCLQFLMNMDQNCLA